MCWRRMRHPEAGERLREELTTRFPENVREKELMDLPFLDAVNRETMHVSPMMPGPLERYLTEETNVGGS